MKKLLLLSVSLSVFLCADLSVGQIENMIVKIHKKRKGVNLKTLDKTQEPFVTRQVENNVTVFIAPPVMQTETKLVLHAIMNQKAYINDSWKSVNDKILGYTLKYIGKRGVVLQNGNQIKKLFLHEDKNDFIKIVEGE